MKYFIYAVALMLFANACNSQQKVSKAKLTKMDYQQVAEEKFPHKASVSYNEDNTYVIISGFRSERSPQLLFSVFEVASNQKIHSGKGPVAYVKWISPDVLEYKTQPGAAVQGRDMRQVIRYDVKKKQRVANGNL